MSSIVLLNNCGIRRLNEKVLKDDDGAIKGKQVIDGQHELDLLPFVQAVAKAPADDAKVKAPLLLVP